MAVLARFRVNEVKPGQTDGSQGEVKLGAVYSPEDVEDGPVLAEIRSFYAATPSGQLGMWINNPDAFVQFQVGDEYYVRLEKIPTEQTVQAIYAKRAEEAKAGG